MLMYVFSKRLLMPFVDGLKSGIDKCKLSVLSMAMCSQLEMRLLGIPMGTVGPMGIPWERESLS